MTECYICGENDSMIRRCRECNLPFCTSHRLPEKHNCPALLETEETERWFDERFDTLYEDDSDNFVSLRGLLLIVIVLTVCVVGVFVIVF